MKEIEVKILEINPIEIEKKILIFDGKKIGSYLINEKLYDFPDGRLNSDFSILRIRTYENEKKKGKIEKTELTFKSSTKKMRESALKIREELQTEVDDAKELEKIVLSLGLVLTHDREKKRTSFVIGDKKKVRVEIDTYPKVPSYMEVEGDESSIPVVVKKLGFDMKDALNISATKVLKKYGKDVDFLKF
jgi:adenylate cyclase, class 2